MDRFLGANNTQRALKAVHLERLINTSNANIRELVHSELPVARVSPNKPPPKILNAFSKDQNFNCSWEFNLYAKCPLKTVFLFEASDPCASFHLKNISVQRQFSPSPQGVPHGSNQWNSNIPRTGFRKLPGRMSSGRLQFDIDPQDPTFANGSTPSAAEFHYRLTVEMESPVMGDYEQIVVFDFGRFLGVPLTVSCGTEDDTDRYVEDEEVRNTFFSDDMNSTKMDGIDGMEFRRTGVATKRTVWFKPRDPKDGAQLTGFEEELIDRFGASQDPVTLLNDTETDEKPETSFLDESLSKSNYRSRMLALLNLEQETCEELLSQKTVQSKLEISQFYSIRSPVFPGDREIVGEKGSGELRFAPSGEAFARVTLSGVLSEDHPAGRLLCQQAETAMIEPAGGDQIFECPIDFKASIYIFIRLPAECVKALGILRGSPASSTNGIRDEISSGVGSEASLTTNSIGSSTQTNDGVLVETVQAKVRFVLSPLKFAEIRYALKNLTSLDVIFPDFGEEFPPLELPKPKGGGGKKHTGSKKKGSKDLGMNQKQRSVLNAIVGDTHGEPDPPVIVVGPFGTGKTFTLAKASKHIITNQPKSRLLICTLSNSAADLYISQYFGKWYQESREQHHVPVGLTDNDLFPKPLRVYYTGRWISSIPEDVIEFCPTDSYRGAAQLRWPRSVEVKESRIVISTLSTAKVFLDLVPPGWFTHIFIDEAGQASEPASLIPLCLATSQTKVILAGDPLQSGAECYSKIARKCGFNVSLLERLWNLYPETHPNKIHLTVNFRTHEVLTEFMGNNFYTPHLHPGQNKDNGFISCCDLQQHPRYYPLTFIATRGIERQDAYSTGYYNKAEVLTVTNIVKNIVDHWPESLWGVCDQSEIGVLSIYNDQVIRIRHSLKKKRLGGVKVEKVQNVQGKEYKVVVVSTVRTLETCYPNAETIQQDMTDQFGCRTLDFGFLSDPRLLNTALTRARTLLVVVGDPASLAAIGPCKEIWKNFIHVASRNGSLEGTTWGKLMAHLDSIQEAVDAGYVGRSYLNARATEFRPLSPLLDHVNSTEDRETERRNLVDGMSLGLWPALVYTPHRGPITLQLPAQVVAPFLPKEDLPYPIQPQFQFSLPPPQMNGMRPGFMYPGGPLLPNVPFMHPYMMGIPPAFYPPRFDFSGIPQMGVPLVMAQGDAGNRQESGSPAESANNTEPSSLQRLSTTESETAGKTNGYPSSITPASSCGSPPIIINAPTLT